jgi:hypothetical protein
VYTIQKERFTNTLLKIPAIDKCEILEDTENGFIAEVELDGGILRMFSVLVLNRTYPQQIKEVINKLEVNKQNLYTVISAPYISDLSAALCEKSDVGYIDEVGNCLIRTHTIYISEKGNHNKRQSKQKMKTIFDPSYVVSSKILRYLMKDVKRVWKLKYLADEVKCSIGQVSKVKNYLCEQLWAEMTPGRLAIIDAEAIMTAWGKEYNVNKNNIRSLYTLESIAIFERKIQNLSKENGICCYFTGFSGGVRYTPVVRYNKVQIIVRLEDYREFVINSECKEVETGSNISVIIANEDDLLIDSRNLEGCMVASPVQIYLDCMQNKGRGEEMAEAVLKKEIVKK